MCAETCVHHATFPSVKKHEKDHQGCMQEELREYRMERVERIQKSQSCPNGMLLPA